MEPDDAPSFRLRLSFWIILGAFSVFFAEVVSGSDMFPYFHLWGIIGIFPLYVLHSLVLSSLVFNYGKPRFSPLYLAGVIFGLYEAYITKVLWNPYWGEPFFMFGGIAVIETIILLLVWHSIMAFVIPLFICENLLTGSRQLVNGLPERIRRVLSSGKNIKILLIAMAIVFGMLQSSNSTGTLVSMSSGLCTISVLVILVYLWRSRTGGRAYSMKSLLPNIRELRILLVLLILLYLWMGSMIRMEALPGLQPQAAVWLLYVVFFFLLFTSLRKSAKLPLQDRYEAPVGFSWKWTLLLAIVFTFTSAIISPNRVVAGTILLLTWFGMGFLGIFLPAIAINDTFRKS
ncbi:MAG: hypothetical protein JXC85_01785 [Candidatus Aenigmarchaeota archaeon]|nr:hypothetical protein [Candidatus Aenigmarchaeota archaeon]